MYDKIQVFFYTEKNKFQFNILQKIKAYLIWVIAIKLLFTFVEICIKTKAVKQLTENG